MGSTRRTYLTVEVKPSSPTAATSNLAPSSPTPSPKAVRFAPCEKSEPRTLSSPELWSLYHYEKHARQCHDCYNVFTAGHRLCAEGRSLARTVSDHIYQQDHVVYSTAKENHKQVRVKTPLEYDQIRELLNAKDRSISRPALVPIISYEPSRSTPVSPRPSHKTPHHDSDDDASHRAVIVEPASSSSRRTKYKSSRYKVESLEEDHATKKASSSPSRTSPPPALSALRGSLYEKDMQARRQESYRVEIRKPAYLTQKERARRRDGEDFQLYYD